MGGQFDTRAQNRTDARTVVHQTYALMKICARRSFIGYSNAFPKLILDLFGYVTVDGVEQPNPNAPTCGSVPCGFLGISAYWRLQENASIAPALASVRED